jgi:5-methylcytosine-specific restriction enzyme subunit McrC
MTIPDIIVRSRRANAFIIDTKWKRLAARIDDPKQGVSQGDVYQMMAYGRVYSCPRLILLYPHHSALRIEAGIAGRHQIIGSDDQLITATVSLDNLPGVPAALRAVVLGCLDPAENIAA